MSVPPLSNNFDGGTDGVQITAANSGGTSGDAFDVVNGVDSLTFSNAQAHSSSLSMRGVNVSGDRNGEWTGFGSITTSVYFRWYMYLSAWPTTNRHYPLSVRTAAGAACALFRVYTNGTFGVADASNSGTGQDSVATVSLNQWVRYEVRVQTSNGGVDWKLFNSPDSTTETENYIGLTGLSLGANVGGAQFGVTTSTIPASPYTFYIDDIAASTTGWIGPRVTTITPSIAWLRA